jgi:hypothetical protein
MEPKVDADEDGNAIVLVVDFGSSLFSVEWSHFVAPEVAQSCTLPYRRIAFGRALNGMGCRMKGRRRMI